MSEKKIHLILDHLFMVWRSELAFHLEVLHVFKGDA